MFFGFGRVYGPEDPTFLQMESILFFNVFASIILGKAFSEPLGIEKLTGRLRFKMPGFESSTGKYYVTFDKGSHFKTLLTCIFL